MRSLPELCVRAAALSLAPAFRLAAVLALLASAALVAPACNLVSQGDDCKAACTALTQCGMLQTSDCGVYCSAMVSNAVIAGCATLFDDQNTCAKDNTDCSTQASNCSAQTTAFTQCMTDYCTNHPNGGGCPTTMGDAGADGG
jgi:hypothetical protein